MTDILRQQIDNNIEIPFKSRVDAFWQWFMLNEAELSEMVGKRGEYDYPYLISRMPETLKGKWHFFPFNQGTGNSFEFQMYGVRVDMAEVQVAVGYNEEQNDFAISFYEENLCSLQEDQSYNAFYIMLEIMLGEGISYQYISEVKRLDKSAEGMIPLPELRKQIIETLNLHGKEVFDNPKDVFISYQLEPEDNEELRYDVVVGSTNFSSLVSQYYQNDTELFDNINHFGARAVFIAFPYEDDGADRRNEVLNFRNIRFTFPTSAKIAGLLDCPNRRMTIHCDAINSKHEV